MHLPEWLPAHGAISAFLHLLQFFLAGAVGSVPFQTGGNVFDTLGDVIAFQVLEGLPEWFSWLLFITLSLPYILLLGTYLFQAFNNAITGAILGIVVVSGILSLVFFA